MTNYRPISTGFYHTIARETNSQIELNPEIREIKFVKVDGPLIYRTYILQGTAIPEVVDFNFIDAAPRKELENILNIEVERSLPQEVRVINPNHKRDIWGIFFKQ